MRRLIIAAAALSLLAIAALIILPPLLNPMIRTQMAEHLPGAPGLINAAPPAALAAPLAEITANSQWAMQIGIFDGVEMVLVPPGCFTMGTADPNLGDESERPALENCLRQPYWIDRFETTNSLFERFKPGNIRFPQSIWVDSNRPRENLRWVEATIYCRARGGRLPTEVEWEYAARGPDNLIYPWGNSFIADTAISSSNSKKATAEVGSRPANQSWTGAVDMAGNVWEWTSSIFQPYPYLPDNTRENPADDFSNRVVRGGSWGDTDTLMRTAARIAAEPNVAFQTVGVRCVRPYSP
jgi:formylglycine-generating enzyme required for sulfatase activity